jgi:hypothetical protein
LKRKSILARHGHRATSHHEGLCHQFGFSAHGFQLGPARQARQWPNRSSVAAAGRGSAGLTSIVFSLDQPDLHEGALALKLRNPSPPLPEISA